MQLSELSPPTLRLIAAALQAKARFGAIGPGSIRKLARHEPGANVDQALAFLGLEGRMEVGADPEPAAT